jgi:hypothetical protein
VDHRANPSRDFQVANLQGMLPLLNPCMLSFDNIYIISNEEWKLVGETIHKKIFSKTKTEWTTSINADMTQQTLGYYSMIKKKNHKKKDLKNHI